MRRQRDPEDAALVRRRLRRVLVDGVPPEVPSAPGAPAPAVAPPDDGTDAPPHGAASRHAAGRPAASLHEDRPGDAEPAQSALPGGWTPDGEPSWQAVELEHLAQRHVESSDARSARSWSGRGTEVAPVGGTGLTSLLPDTVRGGRLDPGRRGAVALLVVALLAAGATAVVVHRARPQPVAAPTVERSGGVLPGVEDERPAAGELVVSVAGTVVRPGLVRLPPGSRVDDALRAAGGLTPGADPGLLNLARTLVDGEQVLVGVGPPPGAQGSSVAAGGALDLNLATADDLDALPGLGPVLAERIVEWRTENGPFRSVDQLREVPGIGEAKYAVLEKKVRV